MQSNEMQQACARILQATLHIPLAVQTVCHPARVGCFVSSFYFTLPFHCRCPDPAADTFNLFRPPRLAVPGHGSQAPTVQMIIPAWMCCTRDWHATGEVVLGHLAGNRPGRKQQSCPSCSQSIALYSEHASSKSGMRARRCLQIGLSGAICRPKRVSGGSRSLLVRCMI